jgi:hypothetical protein
MTWYQAIYINPCHVHNCPGFHARNAIMDYKLIILSHAPN